MYFSANIVKTLSQQIGVLITKVDKMERVMIKTERFLLKSDQKHKELWEDIQELKDQPQILTVPEDPEYTDSEDSFAWTDQPTKRRKKRQQPIVLPRFPIKTLEVMDQVIENIKNEDYKEELVSYNVLK